MRKIAFFCIPAWGHTNPTLGVVRELVSRGHQVRYYSFEKMRAVIESTGAEFIPCDEHDPQGKATAEDNARIGKDLAFATELIVSTTLALDDAILQDLERDRPDCIVGDSMAFWAKLIARKLNVPFVSSTTTFAFNRESAKGMKQGGGLLSFLKSLPGINRSLDRLREKGYAVKSVLDIIANGNDTETVVYTSPEFQPCTDSFSDRYHFVGPIIRETAGNTETEAQCTVYISLGTVDNDRPDFYRNCMQALAGMDCRAVFSVGEDTDVEALGEIPENCTVHHRVDQIAVLRNCSAFLTHCGMNSTSEGLYFGVPLVLFPLTPEQDAVARRVEELGAGLFLRQDDPQSIRNALETVLQDDSFRQNADRIADSFHRCGGAKEAADAIERMCGTVPDDTKPVPIMSGLQIAQAIVGTAALLALAAAIFCAGARIPLLIIGAVLGTASNVLKAIDVRQKKKKQR